jgi:outer membrane lipoprotein carrier protein
MRLSNLTAALLFALGGSAFVSARQASPPAQQVAAALQKKYDAVRDFSADFVNAYEGGVLRKKVSEKGTVQIKKPGMMRWIYAEPERKEFVSDGRRMYVYWPADKQVMVSPVPQEDQATSAVLFLAGKGNLVRDFTVSFAPGAPEDVYLLRLQPRQKDNDYDWLEVGVDKKTLQLRSLAFEDKQGGKSTFRFANFKENPGLSDKIFAFKIPAGADVITNGSKLR